MQSNKQFIQILFAELEIIRTVRYQEALFHETINSFYEQMHSFIFEGQELNLTDHTLYFNALNTKTKLMSLRIFKTVMGEALTIENDSSKITNLITNETVIDRLEQLLEMNKNGQYNIYFSKRHSCILY